MSEMQDAQPGMQDHSITLHTVSSQQGTTSLYPVGQIQLKTAQQLALPSSAASYAVSPADNPLPHADKALQLVAHAPQTSQVDISSVEQAVQNLHKVLAQVSANSELSSQLDQADEGWKSAVSTLEKQIEDLAVVFEQVVFPNNRFTRKRGAYHGSSLHLPGLIKAVSTDFNYKKIFSSKTAGGRRQYNVTILVDVSLSMNGLLAQSAVEALVTIISALSRLSLESFSILLFGERVRIIKSHEMPWDSAAIFTLLSSLSFDAEFASMDADAVECAVAVLDRSSQAGPKKVFVLTDGYGSCGLRFAQVSMTHSLDASPTCSRWSELENQQHTMRYPILQLCFNLLKRCAVH